MNNMSSDPSLEEDDGDTPSSTLLVASASALGTAASRLIIRPLADATLEARVFLWQEFLQWQDKLWRELAVYESRGHSRTRLVLTVVVVFVVAFHVELIRMWRHFSQKGGQWETLSREWTLYYQSKQREWKRSKRLKQQGKKCNNSNNTINRSNQSLSNWIQKPSTNPAKNLASPTSTASTVEAESSMGTHVSGQRQQLLLTMQNTHRPISPRPSPDKPKVVRDAYGLPININNNNPRNHHQRLLSTSSLHSAPGHRSHSIGYSSASRSYSNRSLSSNRSRSRKNNSNSRQRAFANNQRNQQSMDFLEDGTPLTPSSVMSQNQSSSTLASSKDTRSTHASRTASELSFATPNNHNHGNNTPTDHSGSTAKSPTQMARIKASSRKQRRNTSSYRKQQPKASYHKSLGELPSMQPSHTPTPDHIRRTQTVDVSPAANNSSSHTNKGTTKKHLKKKISGTSGVPLAQARRRMSGGGTTAERAAAAASPGLQRTRTDGNFAYQMHPRSRSGNGAMTKTASQMYMMRQPSSSQHASQARLQQEDGKSPPQQRQQLYPRSRSGDGTSSGNHHQPRQPRSNRNSTGGGLSPKSSNHNMSANRTLSPPRTNPNSRGHGGQPRMTKEPSRKELGYE